MLLFGFICLFVFEGKERIAIKRSGLIIHLVSFNLFHALNFDFIILVVDLPYLRSNCH